MTAATIRRRRRRITPKMLAALIVWPFAIALTLMLWISGGPTIERTVAPVLGEVYVENIKLERDKLCWDLDYEKLREARPVTMSWVLRIKGSAVFIPAVVTRNRDGTPTSVQNVAPVGHAVSRLCTLIPPDLIGLPGVMLDGSIEYRTNHPFWTLWYSFPPVPVPAG